MATIQAIAGTWTDSDADACIYYPLWFVELAVSWRRLLLPRRTEKLLVCIDAVREVAYRADALPESIERDVPGDAVMPARVGREGAARRASDLAKWWAGTRLLSWWAPRVESVATRLLHKVYVIEVDGGRRVLTDSLSGESEAL